MDPLFEVHRLNEEGLRKADNLARTFDTLLTHLKTLCPENTREFSIVKTKLEEACFFAKKSLAMNPVNQQKAASA